MTDFDHASRRILDASLNRIGEGLRTMEEIARFVLEDRVAASSLKSLRHHVAEAAQRWPRTSLLTARDTAGDVGTEVTAAGEFVRSDLAAIVAAASSRTAQSLRTIEELCKVDLVEMTRHSSTKDGENSGSSDSSSVAKTFESIRYELYDVAAAIELSLGRQPRRERLIRSRVYGLVRAAASEDAFLDELRRIRAAGVTIVQLRDRDVDDRVLWSRTVAGASLMRQMDGLFIVNDRADIAVAGDADGVHVGQDELPPREVRRIVGPDRLIGLSTHSIDQVRAADQDDVDYIGCGPIYPSTTKSFDRHTGTQWLNDVAREDTPPAFAIGGIDQTNVDAVLASGIGRIAIAGALRDDLSSLVSKVDNWHAKNQSCGD